MLEIGLFHGEEEGYGAFEMQVSGASSVGFLNLSCLMRLIQLHDLYGVM